MHEECFEMWSVTKRKQEGGGCAAGSEVTCPLCTSVWQGDECLVSKIKRKGKVGAGGDVNIADQLDGSSERDSSPERDTTSYSRLLYMYKVGRRRRRRRRSGY
ncbi:hypothetical protein QBC33DRAFT_545586 [Phialemonium atrogriseum]|uniref:Uncharacterized protein n=1 Tax=Phialemonium atrogriseum TaxID=1093897 RepID=A0AAJ0FJ48_9PEZI|nr:uncharacterized protein QBC33DRAFT_545586 [Phialemonium atrogriseum]KAK1765043.1 hypothetical protein QBC33DRAFT_545586 [Phialemonium atrogriseum]